jgi:hypothetical protein
MPNSASLLRSPVLAKILRRFTFAHYVVGRLECSALRGLEDGAFQHLVEAIHYGMLLMYIGQKVPTVPLTDHTPTKHRQNEEIRARYAAGETIGYLARLFDISEQRISQILLGQRK